MALRGKNKRAHSTDSTFLLIFYSVKEVSAQQNWKLHFRKEKEVNIFRNKSEKSGYVIWGTLVLHCLTEEHIFLHPVIFKTVGKCPLEICSVYRGRFKTDPEKTGVWLVFHFCAQNENGKNRDGKFHSIQQLSFAARLVNRKGKNFYQTRGEKWRRW